MPSTLAIAGGGYTEFVLLFQDDIARMVFISDPPDGPKIKGISDKNPPDGPPFITFRVVPEPGTLALALLAMLAIGSVMRRKSAVLRLDRVRSQLSGRTQQTSLALEGVANGVLDFPAKSLAPRILGRLARGCFSVVGNER